jgi:hypothetical protein
MKVHCFLAFLLLSSLNSFAESGVSQQSKARESQGNFSTLRTLHDRALHAAKPVASKPGHSRLLNPGHGLEAEISPLGASFTVTSLLSDGTKVSSFRWRTHALGYGESPLTLPRGEVLTADESNRIEIRRPGIVEWFVNRPVGIEHGYTILNRPTDSNVKSPLRLWFEVSGDFTATVAEGGQHIVLHDPVNGITLNYDKLKSWDANGKSLTSRMISKNGRVGLEVEEAAAVYPITIDPTFTQSAYLKASNTRDEHVFFGDCVAIHGNTAVVGAFGENGGATVVNGNENDSSKSQAGAAYVYVFNGTTWTKQAYLKPSNPDSHDNFGSSVAISGNTIVIGSPSEAGPSTGVNGTVNNGAGDSGAAYVFIRSGNSWSQQAYLKASNTGNGDTFGRSVSIDGDTIIVGAPREDGSSTSVNGANNNGAIDAGAAYVFKRNGSTWTQEAYLKASNAQVDDNFGFSVGVSGDLAIVGAFQEDGSSTGVNDADSNDAGDSGAAYVFARNGANWTQEAYLKASNTDAGDTFGYAVAIHGTTAIVSAPAEDSISNQVDVNSADDSAESAGAAYIFFRDGSIWSQQSYLKASNAETQDRFGESVAISGEVAIVGAYVEDSNAIGIDGDQFNNLGIGSGAAYAFSRAQTSWSQKAYIKAHNTENGTSIQDHFGTSVSIDGTLAIVGATNERSNARGVNGDAFNNSIVSAGAAYTFLIDIPPPTPLLSVYGNGNPISNGSQSTNFDNHTEFGTPEEMGELILRTFSITNEGELDLSFSGEIELTGSDAFQIFSQPDSAIPPGDNAPLVIGFTPQTSGLHQATISIFTNDIAQNPFTFRVRGTAPQAVISVRDGSRTLANGSGAIDFRTVRFRKRSKPASITILNAGTAPLTAVSTSISGKSRKDFKFLGAPSPTVGAGGSSTFQITFTPSKRGSLSAQLEIRSSAENASLFRAVLKGRGK